MVEGNGHGCLLEPDIEGSERFRRPSLHRTHRKLKSMIAIRDKEDDRSVQLFARALELMPGGVNSPVRAFRGVGGIPRFIRSAKGATDRKSTRLNSSHSQISYAV